MAAADVESALVSVLNELDGIFSLKEEQTAALPAYVDKNDAFAVHPTGFARWTEVSHFLPLLAAVAVAAILVWGTVT